MRIAILVSLLVCSSTIARADEVAPVPPTPPPSIPTPAVAAEKREDAAKRGEPVTAELNPYVPWYRGEYGNNRVFHLSLTAGLGLAFLASETLLKPTLAPEHCRWCSPSSIDRGTRNALVWGNRQRANTLSAIDAYVVAPIMGFGLLLASDHKASWSRILDDTIPVAETIAISQLVTQAIKFSVGRSRPYAHFGDPGAPTTTDDNLSFISGHSVLGFSITASAGLVCHWRHYWTEPYVWGVGIALSLSTEYLRMAADKHYLSDVVAGGAVGLAAGLLVPRLMRRDIKIVPVSNGAAVVGMF